MPLGQMQVHGVASQIAVAEQNLNGSQIRPGFQQMRGEGVSPMPASA